jgi:hypothetical protein
MFSTAMRNGMIQFDSIRRNDGHALDAFALPTCLTPRFASLPAS